MAVTIDCRYLGDKDVELRHSPSGTLIRTDAPLDNGGKASTFSPTDLLAASLGSCMLTVMALYAEKHEVDLAGSSAQVVKHMTSAPRRIEKLEVALKLPSNLTPEQRATLERVAMTCPVHRTVESVIKITVEFSYE